MPLSQDELDALQGAIVSITYATVQTSPDGAKRDITLPLTAVMCEVFAQAARVPDLLVLVEKLRNVLAAIETTKPTCSGDTNTLLYWANVLGQAQAALRALDKGE